MKTLRIGDKVGKVERYENGVPVIKAEAQEVKRPDGTQDVVVTVPCLRIVPKTTQ